ncbi:MAG: hypothetical protein VXW32_08525 [Myxococcota bacterium]|nr:hypothetical protein [Myxococcota bacterium]
MQGNSNEPYDHRLVPQEFVSTPERPRYGIYDEGEGVFSAYFHARPTPAAVQFLEQQAGDRLLLLLSGSRRPHSGIPVSSGHTIYGSNALGELSAPAEAIALETCGKGDILDSLLPSSLFCAPHSSLPRELGALFAIILPDRQHFTLLTRDSTLLSELLLRQLHIHEGPEFPEALREYLIAPQDPWTWRELAHSKEQGVQLLEIVTRHSEKGPMPEQSVRCVAPCHGGFWRAGWSW